MAVTEHGRIVLYRHFEAEMGEEKAQTLMDHLLPVGWTELATKEDLRELRFATKQDLRDLRYEVKAEFAEVRAEIADIRQTMATKVDVQELRAEMYKGFTTQTIALMTLMVAMQGLTLAGLKFL